MKKIIQEGSTVLRDTAKEVPTGDIVSPKIKRLLSDMSEALEKEKDGVAIAAPQIGVPLRIFIVSGKLFDLGGNINEEVSSPLSDLVFINPEITKLSKENEEHEEGCLSVRGKYGTTKRAKKTTVRAFDENGKIFERGGSGLLAKIFQHEIDHLNGVLFIDKAENIHDTQV
ncbi:MAG: peptide deformylase [Candidatus Pacebacteria bacterium]|jgi:peptide deformylase|nr:peptide deformylase [Parcubacteria group bacterium]MDP6249314.1 peptide deformylase [Candidatus Paceibacterota bacterium]MDP7159450.1 peptide deformylase [Candidatus Paceibacterota bacterium]MDP7365952.1 peptide deformylase [Candidatus Paceibacterota bacterium]MDP7466255.1 peptide deformylase [Candidatus Paceibacterota bacterium]|tara:strand:- start:2551 stop:3063 length:513 start_codon:yes stop_codon:yes gene_type:complete